MPAAFMSHATAGLLLSLVPVAYLAGALLAGAQRGAEPGRAWRPASLAAAAAMLLVLGAGAGLLAAGSAVVNLLPATPPRSWPASLLSVRLDVLTCLMLGLVSFIGLVILRFSRHYLDGDPRQGHYARWLLLVLAAVSVLVITNNLLVLLLGWIATSLALHQLLTYYGERPQALIAAHKKFIASRVADLCLLAAVALLGRHFGSLEMDVIFAAVAAGTSWPATLQLATVLLAVGAALKCAQLPFHGWLIQVMEAPTPVSALLHAGVVNIGGFLMIRLAPLMGPAEIAQTLLVVCGATTAVVAALVMSTRVSIKVALAWSTCAQMGFMLLECGLGAYSLALLHLVAHSLYKAHAFLASGSVVDSWRAQAMTPARPPAPLLNWFLAAAVALGAVAVMAAAFSPASGESRAVWLLAGIVALSLTPLLTRAGTGGAAGLAMLAAACAAVAGLYFGWHAAFEGLLGNAGSDAAASPWRLGIVAVAFATLFVLQAVISSRPAGRLARTLYAPLFAGLYLDELCTRFTFRAWPARLPTQRVPAGTNSTLIRES